MGWWETCLTGWTSVSGWRRCIASRGTVRRREAVRMMWAVAWHGTKEDAETETSREHLRELRTCAEADAGAPLDWMNPQRVSPKRPWWRAPAGLAGMLGLLALLASTVVGAVTIIEWLAHVLGG